MFVRFYMQMQNGDEIRLNTICKELINVIFADNPNVK